MKLIQPGFELMTDLAQSANMMQLIELAGRTCYKSEERITEDSHKSFCNMLTNTYKHESVLEHVSITVKFITNRGMTHELVRHRVGVAYSQESTRYCSYNKSKFGGELTFIDPRAYYPDMNIAEFNLFTSAMLFAENNYLELLAIGTKPEIAREVLPNALKTEIVVTMNIRAWRHVLSTRAANAAHPLIRLHSRELLKEFSKHLPIFFKEYTDEK